VLLFAGLVYLGCAVAPPSLMDDVDAVQAQIARNMLSSGDWVTARLDGVAYLEKAPLVYWAMALSYKIFGVHDWSARIPIALSAIGLCWLTASFAIWAFSKRAGLYAGLCMATCVGLFLFTRILIPDVMLTFTIALAMWAFLRALDDQERHPRFWAFTMAASLGVGLLLKSLIGLVFPIAAAIIYLLVTRQLFFRNTWKRLRPISGTAIILVIAAPWHILATLRNPPCFAFTLHSGPGQYHGFLWFFFINEQLLRFLNLRYPRDYNTVPRLYFWLLHLVWLFPWSVYLPAVAKLSFKPYDRAGRTRLLALCWIGFLLVFFTFSTTQEYYSMPCYPAVALLLGAAIAAGGKWIRWGTRVLALVAAGAALTTLSLFLMVRNLPAPGEISSALVQRPKAYTLALDHMGDLTLHSLAYLREPLLLAAAAFFIGVLGILFLPRRVQFVTTAIMMVVFFHAARLAMVTFDPYLSSRPLVDALQRSPDGKLIVNRHYYWFSSVFFYTGRNALLLNGRFMNLEYGAYAPDAPPAFLDDVGFRNLWLGQQRYYMFTRSSAVTGIQSLVGPNELTFVSRSGDKVLLTNQPLPAANSLSTASNVDPEVMSSPAHGSWYPGLLVAGTFVGSFFALWQNEDCELCEDDRLKSLSSS
jgi:4-amino-4-deoxy-L-arabinose transferase-like glycosyltransferase